MPAFDLGSEWNVPAFFSGGLLLAAASAAFAAGRSGALQGAAGRFLFLIGAFFAFMALDEVVQIHERFERLAHTDWLRLYVPVVAAGTAAWLIVLRGLWPHVLPRACFIGGAAAWVVAQVLEFLQWDADGERLVHGWMIVPEEMLEMTGSTLFALALVSIWRKPRPPHGRQRPPAAAAP